LQELPEDDLRALLALGASPEGLMSFAGNSIPKSIFHPFLLKLDAMVHAADPKAKEVVGLSLEYPSERYSAVIVLGVTVDGSRLLLPSSLHAFAQLVSPSSSWDDKAKVASSIASGWTDNTAVFVSPLNTAGGTKFLFYAVCARPVDEHGLWLRTTHLDAAAPSWAPAGRLVVGKLSSFMEHPLSAENAVALATGETGTLPAARLRAQHQMLREDQCLSWNVRVQQVHAAELELKSLLKDESPEWAERITPLLEHTIPESLTFLWSGTHVH
jgi:hypothetical protein